MIDMNSIKLDKESYRELLTSLINDPKTLTKIYDSITSDIRILNLKYDRDKLKIFLEICPEVAV